MLNERGLDEDDKGHLACIADNVSDNKATSLVCNVLFGSFVEANCAVQVLVDSSEKLDTSWSGTVVSSADVISWSCSVSRPSLSEPFSLDRVVNVSAR